MNSSLVFWNTNLCLGFWGRVFAFWARDKCWRRMVTDSLSRRQWKCKVAEPRIKNIPQLSNSYSSFINQQFFMILFSKNCNLRERNPCMRGLLNVSIILSKFIYHVKAMHLSEFLVEGHSCPVYHSFYLNQLETILDINDVNENGNL